MINAPRTRTAYIYIYIYIYVCSFIGPIFLLALLVLLDFLAYLLPH